jgi:hypothetical protein
MCNDCEFHRNMRRDASIHAVVDSSVALGTATEKATVAQKPTIWRKFSTDKSAYPALTRAQEDMASGKLQGIEK